ncbi:AAA family ATPase [Sphingobacterium sp. UDSM-2020]|uniref:AAA family ATPase n=1 Tax=Sphingobacterium sp. UDSM-2020 TaxID=2795738 RepID=UPI001937B0E5|nr:ATP-binding protein [Sphingobacterium sp. UDSM-2020]QQD13059.1 AAA family ATPase [Sphingobacterium sp. UDSM-2020]
MNISDLIITKNEQTELANIFLNQENNASIQQLIKEYTYSEELLQYGLPVNNKILLHGSSGCGKTTTAKAIAQKLGKSILTLNLSTIVCSRIGETSQNIKQIFDKAAREKAVLFLDEFDQIAKARGNDDKDVGEMRRLVNTLIQLIDYLPQTVLLIAATNHVSIIDKALLRRFQLQISYDLPSQLELDKYYAKLVEKFPADIKQFQRKYEISYAEARDHAFTQVKASLIAKLEKQ